MVVKPEYPDGIVILDEGTILARKRRINFLNAIVTDRDTHVDVDVGAGSSGYVEYHAGTFGVQVLNTAFSSLFGLGITLPIPGTYIIVGTFDFRYEAQAQPASGVAGQGALFNSLGNPAALAIATFLVSTPVGSQNASDRATISQAWTVNTLVNNEQFFLRARKDASTAGIIMEIRDTGSTILAFSPGSAGGGGVSDHNLLSNVLTAQHHARYTDAEVASIIASILASHVAIVEAHHPLVTSGEGIDVAGQTVSHVDAGVADLHTIYQKESEANPDGSYGGGMSREWIDLVMSSSDPFQASET